MVRVALAEERLKSFGLVRTKLDRELAGGARARALRVHRPAPMARRSWGTSRGYTDIAPRIQISEIVC